MPGKVKDASGKQRVQMRNAAIALAVAAILVFGGGSALIMARNAGLFRQPGDYTTTRLIPGSYSDTIECPGYVRPIRVTDVGMPERGTVHAVLVKNGDYVRQGDTLFEVQEEGVEPQAVTAPVSGTVTDLAIEPEMPAGQLQADNPALRIVDMNVLVGVVQVPEYVSTLVKAGQYVSAVSDMTPGVTYQGMVTGFTKGAAGAVSSEGYALYDATVMFDSLGKLQVDAPITVRMHIEDYGQVYYVPASAVAELDGIAYVDIVRSGKTIERHQVELLGTSDAGSKIIRGDVLTSETVIRANLDE